MARKVDPSLGRGVTRRAALALGGGAVVGCALGAAMHDRLMDGVTARRRPPGALPEAEFLAACIRCGQCVAVCPSATLYLTDITDGLTGATPTFDPLVQPCTMCEHEGEIRCAATCPTGALQPVGGMRDIKMGVAHVRRGRCLAHQGEECDECWQACPLRDEAIVLDAAGKPRVVPEACTGCGMCLHACPADPVAINMNWIERIGTVCGQERRRGRS